MNTLILFCKFHHSFPPTDSTTITYINRDGSTDQSFPTPDTTTNQFQEGFTIQNISNMNEQETLDSVVYNITVMREEVTTVQSEYSTTLSGNDKYTSEKEHKLYTEVNYIENMTGWCACKYCII